MSAHFMKLAGPAYTALRTDFTSADASGGVELIAVNGDNNAVIDDLIVATGATALTVTLAPGPLDEDVITFKLAANKTTPIVLRNPLVFKAGTAVTLTTDVAGDIFVNAGFHFEPRLLVPYVPPETGGEPVADDLIVTTPTASMREGFGIKTQANIAGLTGVTFNHATMINGLDLNNFATLESIALPNLTSVAGLAINESPSVTSVSAPKIATVGGDFIVSNLSITSQSFPLLTSVSGAVWFTSNADLTDLSFPELTSIGDYASFTLNPKLQYVSAPNLVSIGTDLSVSGNVIQGLIFDSLTTIGGNFSFTQSPLLEAVTNDVITSIGGTLQFSFDAALDTVSITGVTEIGGDLLFQNDPALASLTLALTSVGGAVRLQNLNVLADVSTLSSLTSIGEDLTITAVPNLTTLSLPNLTSVDTIAVGTNVALANVDISGLTSVGGGSVLFTACALTAASVNAILAQMVAIGPTDYTINLSGGTNAAPTGQGVTDKNTLIAAGNTVTTN